ncbi:hypothetical protein COW53_09530, partial [bacterium CG17_big_fil_post_rev_8_21_14_2_50_64_8]
MQPVGDLAAVDLGGTQLEAMLADAAALALAVGQDAEASLCCGEVRDSLPTGVELMADDLLATMPPNLDPPKPPS